jgi:hypothetical protein
MGGKFEFRAWRWNFSHLVDIGLDPKIDGPVFGRAGSRGDNVATAKPPERN